MDWISHMRNAIDYIERNLTADIDYVAASREACCSVYHFQRMFSYMAGVPLSEYIRRRRLALAAFDLQHSGEKIIDIGLRYGYDSPTAFTRAFRTMHGISPSEARETGATLKAYPPISFQITIRGAVEMDYRIQERQGFRIVGAKVHTTTEDGACYKRLPEFWGEVMASGLVGQIAGLMNREPMGLLGVSACNAGTMHSDFDYYIAVSTDAHVPEGLHEFTVPPCTWAVFECAGVANMPSLQKRIVTEWLPTSGYEYADAPDIEVYLDPDTSNPAAKCEVWLPIRKRAAQSVK